MYKDKYQKYKNKYYALKNNMTGGNQPTVQNTAPATQVPVPAQPGQPQQQPAQSDANIASMRTSNINSVLQLQKNLFQHYQGTTLDQLNNEIRELDKMPQNQSIRFIKDIVSSIIQQKVQFGFKS
jgi:hypothetical protein